MILCLISFMCMGPPASSKTIYVRERKKKKNLLQNQMQKTLTAVNVTEMSQIYGPYLRSIEPRQVRFLCYFAGWFTANRK